MVQQLLVSVEFLLFFYSPNEFFMKNQQKFYLFAVIFIVLITPIFLVGCSPQRQTTEQQLQQSLTVQVYSSTFASQNKGSVLIFDLGFTNHTNQDISHFQGDLIILKPSGEPAQKARFRHQETVRSKEVLKLRISVDYSVLQSHEGEFVHKDKIQFTFAPKFIDFKGGSQLGKQI